MDPSGASVAPNFTNTTTDRRGLVVCIVLILMVYSILSFLIRAQVKLQKKQKAGVDDLICLTAMLLAVICTVLTYLSCLHGFGTSPTGPAESTVTKLQFSAIVLSYLSLGLSKTTITMLHKSVTSVHDKHSRASMILIVLLVCWSFSSILAFLGASCSHRHFWDAVQGRCTGLEMVWTITGALDILTEVAILANFLWLLYELQMRFERKLPIGVIFALRGFLVGAPAAARLALFDSSQSDSQGWAAGYQPLLWLQAEMHLSVISAASIGLIAWLRSYRSFWGAAQPSTMSGHELTDMALSSKTRSRWPDGTTELSLTPKDDYPVTSRVHAGRRASGDSQKSDAEMIRKTTNIRWQSSGIEPEDRI